MAHKPTCRTIYDYEYRRPAAPQLANNKELRERERGRKREITYARENKWKLISLLHMASDYRLWLPIVVIKPAPNRTELNHPQQICVLAICERAKHK